MKRRGGNGILKTKPKQEQHKTKRDFLRCLLSELYSPSQVASIKFNARADFGMDNEVLSFMTKVITKYGRCFRPPFPAEIFKIILLYSLTPDIRLLVGDYEIPDRTDDRRALSKLEKIREEFYEFKTRVRASPEPHIQKLIDYIFAKILPEHKYLEVVDYGMDFCTLESVISDLCSACPKILDNDESPLPVDNHLVFVKSEHWPHRGYVIAKDIYEMFPELEEFFESNLGQEFYRLYMPYVAKLFPHMQNCMLDQVNAFTNQYFKWMVEMLSFPHNLPPHFRWKYEPLGTPCDINSVPDYKRKLILRYIQVQINGKVTRYFVFIHEVRIVLMKLKKMNVMFIPGGDLIPPEQGPSPVVHEIAEFHSPEHIVRFMNRIIPGFGNLVSMLPTPMYSFTFVEFKALPIVSPYNTHCIQDIQGYERVMDVLVNEIQIGRRLPLSFRALEVIIKRMEQLFTEKLPLRTMVDRNSVHALLEEATELKGKFNGKVSNPDLKLGQLVPGCSLDDIESAFTEYYPQFLPLYHRYYDDKPTVNDDFDGMTRPGEPEVDFIMSLIRKPEQEKVMK